MSAREPVVLGQALDEYFATQHLLWHEPDAGCVGCGEAVLTLEDHRCGSCLGHDVRHCPLCLGDIGALVDREVARRFRQATHDASEAWRAGNYAKRIVQAHQAAEARRAMLRPFAGAR